MTDRVTATLQDLGIQRDEDGWEHNAYRVTLSYQCRRMTTPFKTGLGWTAPPTAADILESLLSDASSADNARSFEDWAADYGYDTDSRKAEKTYRTAKQQTNQLARLLGPDYPYGVNPWPDEDVDQIAARLAGETVVNA